MNNSKEILLLHFIEAQRVPIIGMYQWSSNNGRMSIIHRFMWRYLPNSFNFTKQWIWCDYFVSHQFSVRRKTNVRYFYNADLNLVYLTGNDDKGFLECFYLAVSSSATLDLTATETIRAKLSESHAHECEHIDNVQLMLAIVDPNSTIVYYKLSIGLISLESLREERSLFQQKTRENCQPNSTSWTTVIAIATTN